MAYDEATAVRVRKVLFPRRNIVEKKMMGGLSFMAGGTMCCSVSGRGGMLIRVGPAGLDRALKEPHARPATIAGKIMSGFVRVDPAGYLSDAALKKWIERGLEAAAGLAAAKSKARNSRR